MTAHPMTPLAALLALAFTTSAFAQTPAKPEEEKKDKTKLDTVVVTANKRNEAAHRIPYNVSALTEEQLREDNITDLKKLIAQSEAISAPGNSARFADSVTVRGLNVSAVNANNIEQFVRSTLAYYLDDTPLPNIGFRIKDIARVETLLGPQGTLYGAGSLGGTIRYITNKPVLGKTQARLSTSFYRTENGGLSNDTDVMFNLPIGENLALRGSLARLDEKGYTDRISNPPWRTGQYAWSTKPDANQNLYEDDDWQKVEGGRLQLRWRLTPQLEISIAHAEQDQLAHGTSGASLLPTRIANAGTPAQIDAAWRLNQFPCSPTASCRYTNSATTPFIVNDHTILSRYPEFADRKFRLDSFDLDWDLGFARLHSNTSTFKDSRVGQADYASQGNAFYNWFPAGNVRTSNNSLYMTFDNTFKGLSHETRLTSKGEGSMSWIAGVFFTQQERNYKFDEIFPGIDQLPPQGDFFGIDRAAVGGTKDSGYAEDLGSRYKELALFGELSYAITPEWKVMGGGRVFNYEDKGSAFIFDYAGGLADTNTRSNTKASGENYFKLNTSYQFTPDLLAYTTFSQGFRRGGSNAFRDYPGQTVDPSTQAYGPDSTDNIELGLKGFLFDRQLYLSASVYQINWKDVQTYFSQGLPDPFGLGIDFPLNGSTNGPDARARGLEFSARWRLDPHWTLNYSSATTRSQWVTTKQKCTYLPGQNRPGSAGDPDGPDCRVWEAGGKLNGAPKWKHNLGLRYATEVADHDLSASLNARYVGRIGNDRVDAPGLQPALVYKSYTLFNASLGLAKDNWNASLWVQNLTDVRSPVSVQGLGDTIMGTRMITTTPRTIGLSYTYRYQ